MDELGIILEKSEQGRHTVRVKDQDDPETDARRLHRLRKLKADASKLGIEGLVYEMITWDKTYERPVMAVML